MKIEKNELGVMYRYDPFYTRLVMNVTAIECYTLNILSRTKCGVWVESVFGGTKKWVSNTSKKKYAYPTKQEALLSFVKRKESQVKILRDNLDTSITQLNIAKDILNKNDGKNS